MEAKRRKGILITDSSGPVPIIIESELVYDYAISNFDFVPEESGNMMLLRMPKDIYRTVIDKCPFDKYNM